MSKIKIDIPRMQAVFHEVWDNNEDIEGYNRCYETGRRMHRSLYRDNWSVYHHILEKGIEKYKDYIYKVWNIVLVTPDIHFQIHSNIEQTPKVYTLTKQLRLNQPDNVET